MLVSNRYASAVSTNFTTIPQIKNKWLDSFIDIETYSSIDIVIAGAYKYCESIDFEILMIAYAFDDEPIRMIDLALGDEIPKEFIEALLDPAIEKHAHNANFERNSFRAIGLRCTN